MKNNNFSYIHNIWTKDINFFGNTNPLELIDKYGSPLYVYNENILRTRCQELKNLISYKNFRVNYSAKANTNLSLLKIIHSEGLLIDAMSPGEVFIELKAGYKPEEILFVCNNISSEEMKFVIDQGIMLSVDSLSQLERYGKLNRGGKIAVRINPGVGAGHHEKVITGGKNTKFGIDPLALNELRDILNRYELRLAGLSQHIGSLFMSPDSYLEAASFLFDFSTNFPELEFLDLGGGFGIPYHKQDKEQPLDLNGLGEQLQKIIEQWQHPNKDNIIIKIEPGRFIVAECGIILGQVTAKKNNGEKKYIGTDIGFNVLARPIMYDAYHDLEIYSNQPRETSVAEPVTVVGNICETGDIIAKDRSLPIIEEGDIIGILDAGAYGMSMSSNYNCRLRPAEVLINTTGDDVLIRKRDTLEDLIKPFID